MDSCQGLGNEIPSVYTILNSTTLESNKSVESLQCYKPLEIERGKIRGSCIVHARLTHIDSDPIQETQRLGAIVPQSRAEAILFVAVATGTMLMPQALPDGLALWVRLVPQIPIVISIATTILVSYLLTLSIGGMLWNSTSTFRPVLMREVACWQENLLGSMASWKGLAPG